MSDGQPDKLHAAGTPRPQTRSEFPTDPICGMAVDPAEADYQLDYSGRAYYFCSAHCLHEFQADPALYAQGARGRGAPAAPC